MRVYESESERRCMIEYEYAMCGDWLRVTLSPLHPRPCLLRGIKTRDRRRAAASDIELYRTSHYRISAHYHPMPRSCLS